MLARAERKEREKKKAHDISSKQSSTSCRHQVDAFFVIIRGFLFQGYHWVIRPGTKISNYEQSWRRMSQ
jgi:hypothetical protein